MWNFHNLNQVQCHGTVAEYRDEDPSSAKVYESFWAYRDKQVRFLERGFLLPGDQRMLKEERVVEKIAIWH